MKYFALGLLLVCLVGVPQFFFSHAQAASISTSDPDFSIVLFPDTQYYHGQNAYVFRDQANWVVNNQARLNIKMVIGMGDIIDGGGYPVDSAGNITGTCGKAPSPTWQTQWQAAQ